MTQPQRSLVGRIAGAWRAPARSWREEWEGGPPESRLLAFAFCASVFLTLGPVAAEVIEPRLATGEERTPWFAARLLIGLSFLPLSLYAVAAFIAMVSKALGGVAPAGGTGWKACRLALFWSGVASGPAAVFAHVLASLAGASGAGPLIGGVMWVGLLAPMIAAAQGFSVWRVVAAFAVIVAATYLLAAA